MTPLQRHPDTNKGFVIWLYGLPSSGKSTMAQAIRDWCAHDNRHHLGLDGDVLRATLCADLGFSPEDRAENVRRAAHVAQLAMASGLAVIVSLITPTSTLRDLISSIVSNDRLLIVSIDCSLAECQRRDVKGLYARAAAGHLKHMTGLEGAFEGPREGEFRLKTGVHTVSQCLEQILAELTRRQLIP
jgi:adenylyl-sulfate kinase